MTIKMTTHSFSPTPSHLKSNLHVFMPTLCPIKTLTSGFPPQDEEANFLKLASPESDSVVKMVTMTMSVEG